GVVGPHPDSGDEAAWDVEPVHGTGRASGAGRYGDAAGAGEHDTQRSASRPRRSSQVGAPLVAETTAIHDALGANVPRDESSRESAGAEAALRDVGPAGAAQQVH